MSRAAQRDPADVATLALVAPLLAGTAWLAVSRSANLPASVNDPGHSLASSPLPDMRFDLNSATAAELGLLPGVGPKLAQRIVDGREAHGGFSSLDDLLKLEGVGPATLQSLRPFVVVE